MSEAELHLLRARLIGGQLNKARRGELWLRAPLDYVHDESGRMVLDPDEQVQAAVRLLFETFHRSGSAEAVVRHFHQEGIRWPRRLSHGVRKGEIIWVELEHSRVLNLLHNPRYTGSYVYGEPVNGKPEWAGRSIGESSLGKSGRSLSPTSIPRIFPGNNTRAIRGNF